MKEERKREIEKHVEEIIKIAKIYNINKSEIDDIFDYIASEEDFDIN